VVWKHAYLNLDTAPLVFSAVSLLIYTETAATYVQSDTKKRELLKNPTKIEEIQEKKFIDRN